MVGISLWPIVDAVVVGWRQLRLVKVIAQTYGFRPSICGPLALLKAVALGVVFADVTEHATQWLSKKLPSVGG